MPSVNSHTHGPGRLLASVVFLLGIALLCLVFGVAWSLFRSPVPGLDLPLKSGAAAPPAAGIGIALTAFVRQLLLLAVMTLAGSLVAGKGAQLYLVTAHPPPVENAPIAAKNDMAAATTVPASEASPKAPRD